jgi:CRISPR-associated protein Cmr2
VVASAPPSSLHTVITFAPVQRFISSSRKLRDLYGSSLLLSYLAKAIISDAEQRLGSGCVISPALVNTSRGTPNLLVIRGDYRKGHGRDALQAAWAAVLEGCRNWLEKNLVDQQPFQWQAAWDQVRLHSWEFFHAQGNTIAAARTRLREIKQARDWQAINWTGESSTLSGASAVCRPTMAAVVDPRSQPAALLDQETRRFAEALRSPQMLGEAFIESSEQLSLTELVKRLVTYAPIARQALTGEALNELLPERFQAIADAKRRVWFMADGDRVGEHLSRLAKGDPAQEASVLQGFSAAMRTWAQSLYELVPQTMNNKATVVYAGGDDLLGALHGGGDEDADPLSPAELLHWLQCFPTQIWPAHKQEGLTVSMGLVWTQGKVPQREALAQLRQAERQAKDAGRDRFALRVLFNSGRHIEWICPWRLLPRLLAAIPDARPGARSFWRRLNDDLEQLQSRRGLSDSTAEALWTAHFGDRLALPTPGDLGPQPLHEWMLAMTRVLSTIKA